MPRQTKPEVQHRANMIEDYDQEPGVQPLSEAIKAFVNSDGYVTVKGSALLHGHVPCLVVLRRLDPYVDSKGRGEHRGGIASGPQRCE